MKGLHSQLAKIQVLENQSFGQKLNSFTAVGNHKYKETGIMNSVKSSLKSYSLWLTLYFNTFKVNLKFK